MTTYVVDANLLVLLVVGSYDIALIGGRHKRCREFDAADFNILDRLLGSTNAVVCTPHAMAEASNLVRLIGEPLQSELTIHLGTLIARLSERSPASVEAARDDAFARLGLTDASLLAICDDLEILTTDLDLYNEALRRGLKATNFNHVREGLAPR